MALERLLKRPAVYDAVQWAVGAAAIDARLSAIVPKLAPGCLVVDIGGGTGLNRSLRPRGSRYVCLDPDPAKLSGFLSRGSGLAVRASAAALPFPDACADLAVCKFVAHHLEDSELELLGREVSRVLKPQGSFLFVEALATPRPAGRLLWRFDQGSNPRSPERLRGWLEAGFSVQRWERFAILHDYVIALAVIR